MKILHQPYENRGQEDPKKDEIVVVELSPAVYMVLCGLVQDALQYPSDATHLLKRAAEELTHATANDSLPVDETTEEAEFPRVAAIG